MPHALQCGSSGEVPPARRVAAAAVGRAGPERILPLGAAAGGGIRPQCTARRTDSISLTSPAGRPRPAGPAPPPPSAGTGHRVAAHAAGHRGAPPLCVRGSALPWDSAGDRERERHGAAPPWDRERDRHRQCQREHSPCQDRDWCSSLRWWHQRWHRHHGPGHSTALGLGPALAQSAQGRVTALLGLRPEPAHLPEAVLCIAQGLAA